MLEGFPEEPTADGSDALWRRQRLRRDASAKNEPPLLAQRVHLTGVHLEEIEGLLGRRQKNGLEVAGHLLGDQACGRNLGRGGRGRGARLRGCGFHCGLAFRFNRRLGRRGGGRGWGWFRRELGSRGGDGNRFGRTLSSRRCNGDRLGGTLRSRGCNGDRFGGSLRSRWCNGDRFRRSLRRRRRYSDRLFWRLGSGWLGSLRSLGPLHRAGEELEEVVEHRALVRTQLAVDTGDQLGSTGARLVPRRTGLGGTTAEPADQLTKPFGSSRPLFMARLAGAGVRQLLRNFWEVDLEVVNKDVVHCLFVGTSNYRSRERKFCQGQFGGCPLRR